MWVFVYDFAVGQFGRVGDDLAEGLQGDRSKLAAVVLEVRIVWRVVVVAMPLSAIRPIAGRPTRLTATALSLNTTRSRP